MKNIFKYLILGVFAVVMIACEDEETFRIPQEFATGPNVRFQVDQSTINLDFTNLSNARLEYDLFSESNDIETIELFVMYNNVNAGTSTDSILLITYTQADLDAGGGEIRDQGFTADQLATAVGLSGSGDLNGGDSFVFVNITTMTDGRVYPGPTVNGNLNVTPNVINSALTTSFTSTWTSFVACPLPNSFNGTYDVSPDTCYPGNFTGPVTLTQVNGPIYNMSGFVIYGFADRQINILLVCDQVLIPTQSPGLGCGANALLMQTAATGSGSYDPNDVSELTLRIDYPSTCGGVATSCELTLTKQE